jgi:hypothetical protein
MATILQGDFPGTKFRQRRADTQEGRGDFQAKTLGFIAHRV